MKNDFQKEFDSIVDKAIEEQPILLGALLARLFAERKVGFTIVGGAAVQFYTQAEYTTSDLDVILTGDETADIEYVMNKLGFKRTTTYRHFEHPRFKFVVEFPPSPIEVGNRYIDKVATIETQFGIVRIIRIEDLIMDRIIAAVEWRSPESLKQAQMLWVKHKKQIDRKYLSEFARSEGYITTLKKVMRTQSAR